MIRHIVLIRFRPEIPEAAIAAMFTDLLPIRALVPGIGAIHAGRSESPEQIERGMALLGQVLRAAQQG